LNSDTLNVSILSIENGIFEVKAPAKNTHLVRGQDFLNIYSYLENVSFDSSITRALFEELSSDLLHSAIALVEETIQDAGIDRDDIQKIILVGGSTRIPKVRKLLQDFFSGKELVDCKQINPHEAVARGAAILAASLQGNKSGVIQDLGQERTTTRKRKLLTESFSTSDGECVMVEDGNPADNSMTVDIPPASTGQQIRVWNDKHKVSFKIQLRAY